MTGSVLSCPRCGLPLRLSEGASLRAGKLIYGCRDCDRRFAVGPSDRVVVEETVAEDSGRTQRVRVPPALPPRLLTEMRTPSIETALPPGVHLTLDLTDGPERGRSVRVQHSRSVIGRREGEIRINDPLVSRRHAVVEVYDQDTIILKDLTSTNGTYHNGRLIDHCKLQDGDEVHIGSTIFTVAIEKLVS